MIVNFARRMRTIDLDTVQLTAVDPHVAPTVIAKIQEIHSAQYVQSWENAVNHYS